MMTLIPHTCEKITSGLCECVCPPRIPPPQGVRIDRKSTRLNSSHVSISYAVFCLKKKNKLQIYEINRKDLVDVIALLLDHPVGEGDDAIDARYVARLACDDWGFSSTLKLNIASLL